VNFEFSTDRHILQPHVSCTPSLLPRPEPQNNEHNQQTASNPHTFYQNPSTELCHSVIGSTSKMSLSTKNCQRDLLTAQLDKVELDERKEKVEAIASTKGSQQGMSSSQIYQISS
jgi:hypothetical protein